MADSRSEFPKIIGITFLIALLFNGCIMGVGAGEGTVFPWDMMVKSFFVTWVVLLVLSGIALISS